MEYWDEWRMSEKAGMGSQVVVTPQFTIDNKTQSFAFHDIGAEPFYRSTLFRVFALPYRLESDHLPELCDCAGCACGQSVGLAAARSWTRRA
jgi:hypothetical protein